MKRYILIVFILLPLMAFSQHPWYRISPLPQENTLLSVKKIPGTNKIIAIGSGSTVMISSDFGDSWNFIFNPAGLDNYTELREIEFINPFVGYIVGLKGIIIKTIDGGNNWNLVHYTGGQSDEFRDVNLSDVNNAYAIGQGDLIIRTYDGGSTWDTLFTDAGFTFMDIDFLNADTGYIVGSSGYEYLKTIDGGQSWNILPLGIQQPGITCYEICFPTSDLGIITTTVDGHNAKFFRTTDGGSNWEEVFSFWSLWPHGLDYIDENIIMASGFSIDYSSSAVYTHDGGETWTQVYLPHGGTWGGRGICCDDSQSAITVGNWGQVQRSNDSGMSWVAISSKFGYGPIPDAQFIDDSTGFCISAVSGSGIPYFQLLKTVDRGDNWYVIADPYDIAFHFINNNVGWLTDRAWYYEWLYKTTNGGSSWSFIPTNIDVDEINCIRFYDENWGLLSADDYIYQTEDGGTNWVARKNDWIHDIEYQEWPTCYAAGSGGLYRSNNGGENWEKVNIVNAVSLTDIYFYTTDTAFVVGNDNQIYRSYDGGYTWDQLPANTNHNIHFKSISFASPDQGIAVGTGPFETMVYTIDGGENWSVLSKISTSGLSCIEYLDENTALAFGDKGIILKTETGGITWIESKPTLINNDLMIFPNPFNDYFEITMPKDDPGATTIIISDISGKILESQYLSKTPATVKVDTKKIHQGIIMIQILTEKNHYFAKGLKITR